MVITRSEGSENIMLPIVLMGLVDESDTRLFEELYNTFEKKLFAYSMSILHNRSLSEEAVSETFFRLAKCFKKIHNLEVSELKAFTVIINRNCCYDIFRSEEKNSSIVIDEAETNESFSEEQIDLDNIFVTDLINKLPEIYKDTIILRYYYELTEKETAYQLGISVSAVKKRLKYAFNFLRKETSNE